MLLKSKLIATMTALAFTIAAPAHALGKNERNVLKGVAATVIVGAILNDARNRNAQTRHIEPPRYVEPQRYVQPRYVEPRYTQPRSHQKSVHGTTAAHVFNSYSRAERAHIQRQLARYGYYHGSFDGAFGPRTYRAVADFASNGGHPNALNSQRGAYRVYEALLR